MKKIIVIGCMGSGKSTFAEKLHRKTKIPLFHLDKYMVESGQNSHLTRRVRFGAEPNYTG